MKIMVTGATGFVGSALVPVLRAAGHSLTRLVRSGAPQGDPTARLVRAEIAPPVDTISWDPAARQLDPRLLEGFDAVIHLAGENIGAGRWTAERKRRIRESRVGPTRLLSETLGRLKTPPRVLVSASAIGYYGDRGVETLTEESGPGHDFLASVCAAWEEATTPAEQAGIRVACLRFGIILSAAGGTLPRMLTPFRLGLGGPLGSGNQYMSWVALEDVLQAIQYVLEANTLRGPVNVAAPGPVTNREFTRALSRVLGRPALIPAPRFALKLLLGEMADALLFSSARVMPARLSTAGFAFRFPALEEALRHALGGGK